MADTFARIRQGLASGAFGGVPVNSSAAEALVAVLEEIGWTGSLRRFAEAMPHFCEDFDDAEMTNVLARLGYACPPWQGGLHDLDGRHFPALLVGRRGRVTVVLARAERRYEVALPDGGSTVVPRRRLRGRVLLVQRQDPAAVERAADGSFLRNLIRRFRPTIVLLFALSFLINTISLVGSFAVMGIYDLVIPARALDTLAAFVAGVVVLGVIEACLREIKTRLVGQVSGRMDFAITSEVFGKLLSLPLHMTATLAAGSQLARLKQFETLREIFVGPFVRIGLDLPFTLIFLAVLGLVAGHFATIVTGLAALYVVFALVTLRPLRRLSATAQRLNTERQNLTFEVMGQMRTIRAAHCAAPLLARLEKLSAEATLAQAAAARVSTVISTASATAIPLSGAMTLGYGALLVMDGRMTMGALIAGMMIVWRVMSPLQQLLSITVRLAEIAQSFGQLNQFMALKGEQVRADEPIFRQRHPGALRFSEVTFRYPQAIAPTLLGISFQTPPGALVAVMGASGSGKSTLLRLLLAVLHPQNGSVMLDGVNLRQYDPSELRHSAGYVPQEPALFYGTLEQNLLLAAPQATMAEIRAVCDRVGILGMIEALPGGFAARVTDLQRDQYALGFRQSLALAQALLRQPTILILDEPAQGLDANLDGSLVRILAGLKGRSTVVMATHRPSHAALADVVLALDRGRLIACDKPAVVLPKLGYGAPNAA